MEKLYVGGRLRRLREERALSQVELARMLSISPSYLNQIEHDTRPLSVTVLMSLTEVFGVDATFFAPQDVARSLAELRETVDQSSQGRQVPSADLQRTAGEMPELTTAVVELGRRLRRAEDLVTTLSGARTSVPLESPHDLVRDFFYRHQNYFDAVDRAAEQAASSLGTRPGGLRRPLLEHLRDRHRVEVRVAEQPDPEARGRQTQGSTVHRFDPEAATIELAPGLRAGQQAFRLATQLALLEHEAIIEAVLEAEVWPDQQTRDLARIGLANYFGGAFVLPYSRFHAAAERLRYDVELLAAQHQVSYETVAHRLSTLQRTRLRGVPFIFIRVDRAGNISKRQSATSFHFSRSGGTCPLWNVYESFRTPEAVHTQLAQMPDGQRFLWVARAQTQRRGGFHQVSRTFAVGLGCEIRHARRLVYADGVDLDKAVPTPIGPGCKTCDRRDCVQRAAPPIGVPLLIDEHASTFAPYPTEVD